MLEWLSYLELLSERLAGVVLILPGLVGLLLGIALWLGGSLGRLGLVATTAFMTGTLLGFWVSGRPGVLVGGLGLGMAALVLPRLITGVLTSFWLALATLVFVAAVHAPAAEGPVSLGTLPDSGLTVAQSIDVFLAHIQQGGEVLLNEARRWSWMIRVVLMAVLIALTSIMALLPRLGLALYNAVVGTALITLGMGLLLLHKGSEPLLYAWAHISMICAVWAGMVLFGTTIQLVCCGGRLSRGNDISLTRGRRPRRFDFTGIND